MVALDSREPGRRRESLTPTYHHPKGPDHDPPQAGRVADYRSGDECCASTTAASITYIIQNYASLQDGYTLSGTITTDGNVGTLSASDITGWSFTTSGGPNGFTASATGAGTGVDLLSNLVASTTQLTLADPGPTGFNVLALVDISTSPG